MRQFWCSLKIGLQQVSVPPSSNCPDGATKRLAHPILSRFVDLGTIVRPPSLSVFRSSITRSYGVSKPCSRQSLGHELRASSSAFLRCFAQNPGSLRYLSSSLGLGSRCFSPRKRSNAKRCAATSELYLKYRKFLSTSQSRFADAAAFMKLRNRVEIKKIKRAAFVIFFNPPRTDGRIPISRFRLEEPWVVDTSFAI